MGAPYQPNVRTMLKIKHERTADVVLAGYREHKTSTPERPLIGSLLEMRRDRVSFQIECGRRYPRLAQTRMGLMPFPVVIVLSGRYEQILNYVVAIDALGNGFGFELGTQTHGFGLRTQFDHLRLRLAFLERGFGTGGAHMHVGHALLFHRIGGDHGDLGSRQARCGEHPGVPAIRPAIAEAGLRSAMDQAAAASADDRTAGRTRPVTRRRTAGTSRTPATTSTTARTTRSRVRADGSRSSSRSTQSGSSALLAKFTAKRLYRYGPAGQPARARATAARW